MTFGELMRIKKEKKELSLQDLANIVNCGKSSLCRYENEQCDPSLSITIKIMKALGISFDELKKCTEE